MSENGLESEIQEQLKAVNELVNNKEWRPSVLAILELLDFAETLANKGGDATNEITHLCKQCQLVIPMSELEKHILRYHFNN